MATTPSTMPERPGLGSMLARAAAGAIFMVFGGSAVLWGVMNMNGQAPPPPPDEQAKVNFAVASKPPPKKKKPKPKPKPKKRSRAKARSTAAPPNLGSSIGVGSFAMPGFGGADFETNDREVLGDVKAEVMTAEAVDRKPQPRRRVQPKLPRRAVAKGIEGYVLLNVLIDERGAVERVRVLEAKPPGLFEQAATDAIKQWQFDPATYQGQPVKLWVNQKFNFKLR